MVNHIKECVLADKECIECGECNVCDLDPDKICDNCCKCIDIDADYKSVDIDEILEDDESIALDAEELESWKYGDEYIVDYSGEDEDHTKYHK